MNIETHPLTNNPTQAWEVLSKTKKCIQIKLPLNLPSDYSDKVRVVCMSDTHSFTPHIRFNIPDGDVFIHAGDFTRCGSEEDVVEFNKWLGKLPHRHKIVIAGNHEISFDRKFTGFRSPNVAKSIPPLGHSLSEISEAISKQDITAKLTNCIYLQDEGVELFGLKFYGTPWQPVFQNWAFNLPRGEECLKKWNLIPDDTDILITHTPPLGYCDLCWTGVRAGCTELLSTVQMRVRPKYHVFGHIHEGYGVMTDGSVIYVNASTCNIKYTPVNPPIVFDISLPPGVSKLNNNIQDLK